MKYTSEIFKNKGQKSSFWPSALTIEIHCQGKKKFASIHNVPRHYFYGSEGDRLFRSPTRVSRMCARFAGRFQNSYNRTVLLLYMLRLILMVFKRHVQHFK